MAGCGWVLQRYDRAEHLPLIPGPAAPEGVGLDIAVEEIIRVELGAVAGEQEQPEPIGPLRHPALDRNRQVHGVSIDDEEHQAPRVTEEALNPKVARTASAQAS
jgi:hypothetical protein